MTQYVTEAINRSSHLSVRQKSHLRKICGHIDAAQRMPESSFYTVRQRLNDLLHALRARNLHQHAAIVAGAIGVIKNLRDTQEPDYEHHVTDHAFCSAIRRLGYDMAKYKDLALAEASENGLIPVMKYNKIITFLPAKT